jgi:hypothetical protein
MLSFCFGVFALLITIVLWFLVVRLYTEVTGSNTSRREIKTINESGNVLSLKQTISNDILTEALLINVRQERLNELISRGDLSDAVQTEQVMIEHARKSIITRSLNAGLLDEKSLNGTN